jgi:hydrogenase maturation factor HypF (carbamoyltransferase family)
MAQYELAMEQFFKDNPDLVEVCQEASYEMEDACQVANKSTRPVSVQQANVHLMHTLTQENVMKRMQDWRAQKTQNAMFHVLMDYLHQVETILYFVAAFRNGDLHLHLQAGEEIHCSLPWIN